MLLQVNTDAIASFSGTLKSADKKWVILAMDEGQTLRMFVTAKTKFVRKGASVKPSEFHDGESVTVEAERDVRMNLIAVKVEFPARKPE